MKVVVTGNGKSGSWRIRGEQLGTALGATVAPCASEEDLREHDVAILVKRAPRETMDAFSKFRGMKVWDIVDAWPQPACYDIHVAIDLVNRRANELGVDFCVFATDAMRLDLYNLPGFVLRHHGRPLQSLNPIRTEVQAVAYEGSERYLPPWIELEVQRLGWRFVVNPPSLAECDIVVAARHNEWNTEICRRWKSNVKLANAQITKTPCLLPYEAGYWEVDSRAPVYYRDRGSFRAGLETLADISQRTLRAMVLNSGARTAEHEARRYKFCLETAFTSFTATEDPERARGVNFFAL